MAGKGRKQVKKTTVRFDEEDIRDLDRCQQIVGGLSHSDTLRILMRLFLNKIPRFSQDYKGKK